MGNTAVFGFASTIFSGYCIKSVVIIKLTVAVVMNFTAKSC